MAVVNSGHLCELGNGQKRRKVQELLQAKKKKKLQDMVLENKVHFSLKENIVHKKGI